MKIVFENSDFVAVDKGSGWLTVPGRTGEADPRPCLGIELQKLRGVQIFPVHRLDFEVSGLVLFALNAQAHRLANKLFEERQLQKRYQAVTTGNPSEAQIEIGKLCVWESMLERGKKRAFRAAHGKFALTHASWLGPANTKIWPQGGTESRSPLHRWFLEPKTGRSHQLRFELADRGFPIVGDVLYGSKESAAPHFIALRSVELDFTQVPPKNRGSLPDRIQVSSLWSTAV